MAHMATESGQELKFDITNLYMNAPAFSHAGSDIGDAVSQAASRLKGLGSFWGNDEPGHKFGAAYEPNQAQLLQLLAIAAGDVEGVADGINEMAREYGVAEQGNIAKLRALNQEMK